MPVKWRKPWSSTWVTISPISSMWPTTASRGPSPAAATRATVEPTVSELTCAPKASAAARHTRVGAVSYPDGPGAVSSWRSGSGIATGPEQ